MQAYLQGVQGALIQMVLDQKGRTGGVLTMNCVAELLQSVADSCWVRGYAMS
jgi:hypothetical protein